MLKSFIISFCSVLTIIFSLSSNNSSSAGVSNTLSKEAVVQEPWQISPSCNQVNAISDIMFGEGENQSLSAKKDLGYFLISEASKSGRTLCQELNYRMPGGDLKYSSMHKNLNKLKEDRASSYKIIREQAENFWKEDKDNYRKMSKYNHYITLSLAKNRPPSWFKYYIRSYYISGDHVFADLDFRNKHQARKSGKYLPNYNRLIKDINALKKA
jgi:hypothetical protein